ncbi:protein asteroid homolog 1-like [Triplophysa dalaica]|uniref:protein asteroid homolog 1-like n=1 Tax=Triplophysa dalaica TaxID=1582913 RepID=UPI0024DF48C9|nr:protein asteroid homolog 1-like [Triplophysa dalaica]
MGVRRLKSYIENKTGILRDLHFRDSRLIIDGCNVYKTLYIKNDLDQEHGGDYDAFEDLITIFFTNLKDCDIRPYVVLDGGGHHTDKKFETTLKRDQDKGKTANELSSGNKGECFPLLIKNVFMQTLDKLKVPLVQCIDDADMEIAALAKQWKCPVLSNDSDFYIFDLKEGILPFEHFLWKAVLNKKGNEKYILTKHYKVERLCASFNNMNKALLPVFACLLGNDYTNLQNIDRWERHSNGAGKFARIEGLLSWLSKSQSQNQAIYRVLELIRDRKKKDKVCEELLEGVKEYEITGGSLVQFFDSKTPTACTGPLQALPEWTVKQLNEGKMGSFLINIMVLNRIKMLPQVEDFNRPSSNDTSRTIRQVLYGLILLGEQQTADKHVLAAQASTETDKCYVTEFDREGLHLASSKVEAVRTKVKEGLQLKTLCEESHHIRLQVFQDVLGVPTVTLENIPPNLILVVFVTHFWLVNAQPQPKRRHLWSLLLGMVHGRFSCNTQRVWNSDIESKLKSQERIPLNPEAAHLYSQWQSCLWWALCLNRLLCLPLPEPECARLYSGTLVHRVVQEFKSGIRPESMLVRDSKAEHLFLLLNDAILSLVDEDVMKTYSDQRYKNWSTYELSSSFEDPKYEYPEDCNGEEVNREEIEAKGHDANKNECFPYPIRTRHKAKERNSKYPCKKFERGCFEYIS